MDATYHLFSVYNHDLTHGTIVIKKINSVTYILQRKNSPKMVSYKVQAIRIKYLTC